MTAINSPKTHIQVSLYFSMLHTEISGKTEDDFHDVMDVV